MNIDTNKKPSWLVARLSATHVMTLQNQPFFWLISVGKENFEDEKLYAQLDFIAERKEPCTLFLADTLQRFNEAAQGFSLNEACDFSAKAGDAWLARYWALIQQKKPDIDLVRWDTWRCHPDFAYQKAGLLENLKTDPAYEKALQVSVDEYCTRQEKKEFPSEAFKTFSRDYLIEECTVLRLLALHSPIKKILYPGAATVMIEKTLFERGMAWLPLRFKRNKALLHSIDNAEFLKKILFHLPTHVYIKDEQGRYVWCNKAHLCSLGFQAIRDITGKTDEQLPWKAQAEKLKSADQKVLQTGKSSTSEETVNLAGKTCVFLSEKKALRVASGKIIGLLGVSVDITDRKKAEEAKTAFLENMRHDIRTPLSGIIGLSEGIAGLTTDSEVQRCARYIFESGLALLDFLNAILESIRLHEHPPSPDFAYVDFERLLEEMKTLHQSKAIEKKLTFSLENRLKWIFTDGEKIRRILLELLSNAFKFTTQGEVTVTTLIKKNDLLLSIRDTGIGIPESEQAEIFKPFIRLTPSWQGAYKGLGLGLNNVQRLLKDLGGHINFLSEPQKGSCFVCTVPLAKKPALLFIEDSPVALLVGRLEFEKKGFHVITAETVKEALEKIKQQPYALIITDIGLPDGKGDELAQRIKKEDSPNRETLVVALTAHAPDGLESGLLELFEKPLTPEKVDTLAKMAKLAGYG